MSLTLLFNGVAGGTAYDNSLTLSAALTQTIQGKMDASWSAPLSVTSQLAAQSMISAIAVIFVNSTPDMTQQLRLDAINSLLANAISFLNPQSDLLYLSNLPLVAVASELQMSGADVKGGLALPADTLFSLFANLSVLSSIGIAASISQTQDGILYGDMHLQLPANTGVVAQSLMHGNAQAYLSAISAIAEATSIDIKALIVLPAAIAQEARCNAIYVDYYSLSVLSALGFEFQIRKMEELPDALKYSLAIISVEDYIKIVGMGSSFKRG